MGSATWKALGRALCTVVAVLGCGGPSSVASPDAEGRDAVADTAEGGDAELAVHGDGAVADGAIERLRARGAGGLESLLSAHPETLDALRRGERSASGERLRSAIDRVAGQRDAHASGLFWHTDLGTAQAEARQTGRPILSLRLLGRLDEELSCANSRYFRIVLYSHPELAETLRRDWVLHWSSERPAPRITIDMGDGRRIETTITGNSVHYVLDADGRPLDALVGLYTPEAFGEALEASRTLLACNRAEDCLAEQHRRQLTAFERRWAAGGPRILPLERAQGRLPPERLARAQTISATRAMELTLGKMIVETPLLRALGAERLPPERVDWERIGGILYGSGGSDRAPLHPASQALLRLKIGRWNVHDTAVRLAVIARADTARNEVLFRMRIHTMFATRPNTTETFERLNDYVYARLLETPRSDPWLGLREPDVYDGVEVEAWD